jgi:hypothetical protein
LERQAAVTTPPDWKERSERTQAEIDRINTEFQKLKQQQDKEAPAQPADPLRQ